MSAADLKALQDKLGYHFKKRALLEHALTHSSKSGEASNERLEFLGDRVLNLVVARALYETFPKEAEGALAKRHAGLVQGRTLAAVALEISLGPHLNMSDAERGAGGADNENILSDAMEAVLGAIFLDGGLEPAENLILACWGERVQSVMETHTDPKTELQEWAQGRGLPLPSYEIVGKSGPDHAPLFEIELVIRGRDSVRAHGSSRRIAEKEAARLMLAQIKDIS